jgi:K+-sensing histidine kinase KdpD
MSRVTVGQPADGARLPEDPVRPAPSRRERILVGIRANERAIHLVRAGKRIADQCGADWTVVSVQTTGLTRVGTEAADLLSEAFRLAESLGSETVSIDGSSAAASLIHYARIRQVSRIVVGARRRQGLRRFVRRDVASLLVNSAASAQVIVVTDSDAATITGEYKVRRAGRLVPGDPMAVVWSRYLRSDAPLAFLDGQLIVQLLSNLLENAAKHTPPSTLISIGAVTRGDWLVLTVEDDGPGFGTRDPQTLFEKFERGQVEGHVSGVGLGLAICRVIATLHRGEICAVNRPTGGARFEITLPLVPTHRPQIVANT